MNGPDSAVDWNHLRTFLATVEAGSYSGASRQLAITQPTIGRQMAALEEALGVVLFERVGRGVTLTPTALSLVEDVRAMASSALRVSRLAAGQSLTVAGPVCISASEAIATWLLPSVIMEIRRRHPGIEVEVVASNAPQDLRRREADIAIRNFRPTEPDLVARRLPDAEAYFYATPGYLADIADIAAVADVAVPPTGKASADASALLARASILGFDTGDTFREGLNARLGLSLEAHQFPVVSQSQTVQWALVKAGGGVGLMMAQVGDVESSVVRVSAGIPALPIPMWLVTHRDVHTSRRLRVVADILAMALSSSSSSS